MTGWRERPWKYSDYSNSKYKKMIVKFENLFGGGVSMVSCNNLYCTIYRIQESYTHSCCFLILFTYTVQTTTLKTGTGAQR